MAVNPSYFAGAKDSDRSSRCKVARRCWSTNTRYGPSLCTQMAVGGFGQPERLLRPWRARRCVGSRRYPRGTEIDQVRGQAYEAHPRGRLSRRRARRRSSVDVLGAALPALARSATRRRSRPSNIADRLPSAPPLGAPMRRVDDRLRGCWRSDTGNATGLHGQGNRSTRSWWPMGPSDSYVTGCGLNASRMGAGARRRRGAHRRKYGRRRALPGRMFNQDGSSRGRVRSCRGASIGGRRLIRQHADARPSAAIWSPSPIRRRGHHVRASRGCPRRSGPRRPALCSVYADRASDYENDALMAGGKVTRPPGQGLRDRHQRLSGQAARSRRDACPRANPDPPQALRVRARVACRRSLPRRCPTA